MLFIFQLLFIRIQNFKKRKKIMKPHMTLVMCGSFNPVTRAHLKMFDIAKNYLISKLPFEYTLAGIISPVNDLYVFKKELLKSDHRINMINLSLKDANLDWVRCDDWESNQKEWQRTLQVLQYHLNRIKSSKDRNDNIQVKLLSGADLIRSMSIPGLWNDEDVEAIVKNFGLIIIPRFNFNIANFVDNHPILSKHKQNVIIIDCQEDDCSSTKVRDAIKNDFKINDFVYDSVANYIQSNNLYK